LKTFFTRTISGILYAAIIIGSIYAGPVVFGLVMLAVLLLGLSEFYKILKLSGINPHRIILFLPAILIYATGYLIILSVLPLRTAGILLLILFLSILIQSIHKTEKNFEKTGMVLLGIFYLSLPLLTLNLVFYNNFKFEEPVEYLVLGLFFLTWVNDTFAYITGSLLGKHKLFERISPNKTWEGSFGGLIFSLAAAYVMSMIFTQIDPLNWMVLCLITVIFGTLGDLFESKMKRNAGIKESGNIIPGHGGILDRFDSILIAAPFVFMYVYFILN